MPANSEESLLPIMGTMETSVAKEVTASDLSSCSKPSSRQVLMQKIHFLPAERSCHSHHLECLRAKYTPLNASSSDYSPPKPVAHYKCPQNIKMSGDDLPTPKVVLYPPENVRHDWQETLSVGAGLVNMGNTCFLNSTLQCLTYTAPLVNYLMGDDHHNSCKLAGFCMLCELHQHIKSCFKQSGRVEPRSIVDKLQVIAKHMHLGRQEDAQEFLRYVVDRMQEACLNGHKHLDYVSKQTTAVSQIFGGYLRSQVVCLKCKAKSNTYEMFMDISLDIENAPSVVKAFEKYTQPEKLDTDNAYNCTECKQKVMAEKKFTIHKAPNVLTIQLKRFDYFRHLAKVTRHVKFSEQLDLQPFMSSKEESSVAYELYAVLVHSGYTCTSGHYYCYIKAPNSMWYCMNDQHVTQVSIGRVLNAEAYLLFYKRIKSEVPNTSISEIHPTEQKPESSSGKPSSDLESAAEVKPSIQANPVTCDCKKDVEEIVDQAKPESPPVVQTAEQQSEERKPPRVVIRIKHGAVCYNSVSDWMEKNHQHSEENQQKSVPYIGSPTDKETLPEEHTENNVTDDRKDNSKSIGKSVRKIKQNSEPVVDQCLETTTSVPGCYAALDKMASWMAARKSRRLFTKGGSSSLPKVNKIGSLRKAANISRPKANGNSRWNIWNYGAHRSSSVTSSSGVASTESTARAGSYQVKQQRAHIPKFKHFGWTSTRKKLEKTEESGERALVEKVLDLSAYDFHEEDCPTLFSFSRTRPLVRVKVPSRVNSDTSCCDVPSKRHKKHKKKKKKHKKHKKHNRAELENSDNKTKNEKMPHSKKWKEHNGFHHSGEVASSWADAENVIANSYKSEGTYRIEIINQGDSDDNSESGKRGGHWSSQTRIKRIKICHATENRDNNTS